MRSMLGCEQCQSIRFCNTALAIVESGLIMLEVVQVRARLNC